MTLVDTLLAELKLVGVQELFGIPGDFILPLLTALQVRNELPFYYLSHEPSAVFAADAAARINNRPSAVILTYGAGALNGVNAVAQAYVEHVPLIVIAGYPSADEIRSGLSIHHQAKQIDSQRNIFREITATQVRLTEPELAANDIRYALQCAKDRSLPVLIEIPRDAAAFESQPLAAAPLHQKNRPVVDYYASSVAVRLRQARAPVILAGIDVRRFGAGESLMTLIETLQIPCLTSFLGRGAFPPKHPLNFGTFIDQENQRHVELLKNADLILFVGVIKTDSNFAANRNLFPKEKVVEIHHGGNEVGLSDILDEILNQTSEIQFNRVQTFDAKIFEGEKPDLLTQVAFSVKNLLADLHEDTPIVSDVGDCLFASLELQQKDVLAPAFYASMGYAVPAAFGIQASTGRRPVVFVGDGAFLMTGLELGHFKRHGFAPIIVLFNNKKWDMINAFAPELSCTDLDAWNYSALVNDMGGVSCKVINEEEFSLAFKQALRETRHVSLIEVVLPPGTRTERLQRFANNFLAAQAKSTSAGALEVELNN